MTEEDKNRNTTVLVVDDDVSVTASIAMLLKQHGYTALKASNPQQAICYLKEYQIDLVLQDMNYSRNTSGEEGMWLLQQIKNDFASIPVVLMTAWGSIELAVTGIKSGAADFITKPWNNKQLIRLIDTCIDLNHRTSPELTSRKQLDEKYNFSSIVGEDHRLIEVLDTIGRVAETNASVLILGESGTGKELIADAIHNNSQREQAPFVKVNLGGMSSSLFESEMFGHVRGAFTDAKRDRLGRFELADTGTIFLDEIGDLDPASQVKLLRVLQDQSFQPVGSSESRKSDVRVVSATNRDLADMVETGSFREDLLYRLNLITIELPPLRERKGDIRSLAKKQLNRIEKLYGLENVVVDEGGFVWLEQQQWPGNVRQLAQTIERATLMSGSSCLSANDFQTKLALNENKVFDDSSLPVGDFTLDELEKMMIEKSMKSYQRNITKVAGALGISRAALYRRLEKHRLNS